MIYLVSDTDELILDIDDNIDVEIHCSFVDLDTTSGTPLRQNSTIGAIGSITIVDSPAENVYRGVKFVSVRNTDVGPVGIVIRHTDGVTPVEVFSATVEAGESLIYEDQTGWKKHDSTGKVINEDVAYDVDFLRTVFLGDRILQPAVVAPYASNTALLTVAGAGCYQYEADSGIAGVGSVKLFPSSGGFTQTATSGISFGAVTGTIPADKWGILLLQNLVDTSTYSFKAGTNTFTTGYDSMEDALADAPVADSGNFPVCFVLQLADGDGFVVGTDSLSGATIKFPGWDYAGLLET